MSGQHLRWSLLAALVAAGLILIGRGQARAGDLDKVAGQQQVAAQKALADIKKNIAKARATTDPKEAEGFLRVARYLLDDDEDSRGLSAAQRADLAQQIQRGLKQVEDALRA